MGFEPTGNGTVGLRPRPAGARRGKSPSQAVFGVLALLLWLVAGAGPPPAAGQEEPPAAAEPAGEALGPVDASHATVSRQVESISRRLDAFFGGDRVYDESTGTYVRLGGSSILRDDGTVRFRHRFRVHLDLPHTERRFSLLIDSDPEEDLHEVPAGGARRAGEVKRALPDISEERPDYSTALRLVVAETRKWHVNADTGIRLEFPLDPFVKLRARRSVPLGRWVARLTERLFWFNGDGFGASTRLDFDRPASYGFLFRSASEAVWRDREGEFELAQNLFLFHRITPRHAMVYRVGVAGESEPRVRATEYAAGVGYRQKVYRDWLFFETGPEVVFAREDAFRPELSVAVRLEAILGGRYVSNGENATQQWIP